MEGEQKAKDAITSGLGKDGEKVEDEWKNTFLQQHAQL